jgi:hypothetical protein
VVLLDQTSPGSGSEAGGAGEWRVGWQQLQSSVYPRVEEGGGTNGCNVNEQAEDGRSLA